MKFEIKILLLFFSLISCKNDIVLEKKANHYKTQINQIKTFVKDNNYNKNIAFMIDYSLHSGTYRFFVVNLITNKIIKKGLVCHGSCKGKNKTNYAKHFSNTNDSYCTSLGMAVVQERAYSKWGKNYKYWLKGLENTNSNMRQRVVVLHAWEGVTDNPIYPNTLVTSFGCPTVSINFLDTLDILLKDNKNVLLYSF